MYKGISCGIIIAAGGSGTRILSANHPGEQAPMPKQFREINGIPMLVRTLQNVCLPFFDPIVLVLPEEWVKHPPFELPHLHTAVVITAGGKSRQESVYNGLAALPREVELVAVHDAARPFADEAMITALMDGVISHGAAVPGVLVKDTLKTSENNFVTGTLDRSRIIQIQTPQVFRAEMLKDAYERAAADGFEGTDDASLVEYCGGRVYITEGSYHNIKITTQEDLLYAEYLGKRFHSSEGSQINENRRLKS